MLISGQSRAGALGDGWRGWGWVVTWVGEVVGLGRPSGREVAAGSGWRAIALVRNQRDKL